MLTRRPAVGELLRQLRSVGELQRRLLPRTVPRPDGWRVAVHYAVGRWPGGDYYDFVALPDGRLLLLLADAGDRGPAAAALVAMVKATVHACPLSSGADRLPFCPVRDPVLQPPHILFGHLNRVLWEHSLEEQFLAAFAAVLEPIDGTCHYANAGRPAPLWRRAATGAVEALRDAVGLPLGADRRSSYHQRRIEIGRGDVLLFFSDGLVAAQGQGGRVFGCEPLDEVLREAGGDGAEAVKGAVLDRFDEFLGGNKPFDDVTLLVVEREA
jgi:sigma-B regulation protein RsbU (phosphoserine phosphatase)